jgi:hypothetical protein
VWTDLGTAYASSDPPQSDEDVAAAGLDAWIAGVVSSHGRFTATGVHDLMGLLEESDESWPVKSLLRRTVALISLPE